MMSNKPSKKKGYAFVSNAWIFDNRIKNELRLLIYISSLTAKNGYAFASNEHLAKEFNLTTVHISRQIRKLIDLGYIECSYTYSGKVITGRQIRLTFISTADNMNVNGTVNMDVKDNITSNNKERGNKEKALSQDKDLPKQQRPEHAKDKYAAGYNKDDLRPYAYMKQQKRLRYEQFYNEFGKHIQNPNDFLQSFNDKYDYEGKQYDPDTIYYRLRSFARNWQKNENK